MRGILGEYSVVNNEPENRIFFNTTTLHQQLWVLHTFLHNLYVPVEICLFFEKAERSRHFIPGFDIEIGNKASKLNF